MDLIEISKTGEPLGIDLGEGNRRIMAELFLAVGGIVFADIGWSDPLCSFNPFHYVKGRVSEEDPWFIGDHEIFKITRDDDLYHQWECWERAKAGHGDSSRAGAYKSIINGGLPGVDIFK